MTEQRKTVSEVIAEMRKELNEGQGEDAELFAPYLLKPKKQARPKKKTLKKKGKKPAKKAKAKKKPAKKKRR